MRVVRRGAVGGERRGLEVKMLFSQGEEWGRTNNPKKLAHSSAEGTADLKAVLSWVLGAVFLQRKFG